MVEFAVEVWNREFEGWDCFKGSIHCAREANELVDILLGRGYFARVVAVD